MACILRMGKEFFVRGSGAGMDVVWPQFIALAVIGAILFGLSLGHFRKALGGMA